MGLKTLLRKTTGWMKNDKNRDDFISDCDDQGLIAIKELDEDRTGPQSQISQLIRNRIENDNKARAVEVVQQGISELGEQMQGINDHLSSQLSQQQELVGRIEKLPGILESLPAMMEKHGQTMDAVVEHLKHGNCSSEKINEMLEKIPQETSRQTEALTEINSNLQNAAQTNSHIRENFSKLISTMQKLDANTVAQSESIIQMSKTFASSDRYLKYLVSRQNRRIVFMFILTLAITATAIGAMFTSIWLIIQAMPK